MQILQRQRPAVSDCHIRAQRPGNVSKPSLKSSELPIYFWLLKDANLNPTARELKRLRKSSSPEPGCERCRRGRLTGPSRVSLKPVVVTPGQTLPAKSTLASEAVQPESLHTQLIVWPACRRSDPPDLSKLPDHVALLSDSRKGAVNGTREAAQG